MDVVSMHQAKSTLSSGCPKVGMKGEEVYIGAYGKAQAKIVALGDESTSPLKDWCTGRKIECA